MLNIIKLSGYQNQSIFYLDNYANTNVYFRINDNEDEIINESNFKQLYFHDININIISEILLIPPALNISWKLYDEIFYYSSFCNINNRLSIHRVNCYQQKIDTHSIQISNSIILENALHSQIFTIDDRFCIVRLFSVDERRITSMMLCDFLDFSYIDITNKLGNHMSDNIEAIFTISNPSDPTDKQKEELVFITGSCRYSKTYDVRENFLPERIIVYRKDNIISKLKSEVSIHTCDYNLVEDCLLNQTLKPYCIHKNQLIYTIIDFDKNTTSLIKYDPMYKKSILSSISTIVNEPLVRLNILFSIERIEDKIIIMNTQTNEEFLVLSSSEIILAFDEYNLITYQSSEDFQIQLIYHYDLREQFIEKKFLGTGFAQYCNNTLIIFS